MVKLKVIDNQVVKKIDFNEKYSEGIFLVTENKDVKKNCKMLNIDLGDSTDPNELKQRVTKLVKTGILTTRILNVHFQYIIKDYASITDFDKLIQDVHPSSRDALTKAYNLAKINDFEQFSLTGGALDNKN